MKVERLVIKECCGGSTGKALTVRVDRPVMRALVDVFVGKGFVERKDFTSAGVLFVHNSLADITGQFGGNKLTIRCKKGDSDKIFNDIEVLLISVN